MEAGFQHLRTISSFAGCSILSSSNTHETVCHLARGIFQNPKLAILCSALDCSRLVIMLLRKNRQPLLGIDLILLPRELSDSMRVWEVTTRTLTTQGTRFTLEKLWREFFSDPSQWLDNRLEKENLDFPDFTHRKRREGLWLDNRFNPPWVPEMVAALAPGTIQQSSFRWNKSLERCIKERRYGQAIDLFRQMKQRNLDPDAYSFVLVLRACAELHDLTVGRRIHSQIQEAGLDCDGYAGSSLVAMYAKCRKMVDAQTAFDRITKPDVYAWSVMIQGYVKCGEGRRALDMSQRMIREGVEPDNFTFVAMLNACGAIASLQEGRRIHKQVARQGCEIDVFVANSLVDMYFKCGSVADAEMVFHSIPSRNVVSWTTMILGYVKCNEAQRALQLSQSMLNAGIMPNALTYVGLLRACTSLFALEEGRRVHEQLIRSGHEANAYVGTSLISMYAACGRMEDAHAAFDKLRDRNVISWNALVSGYVNCGQGQKALELYHQMQQEGVDPDPVTLSRILNACASVAALEAGRRVHEQILERGFQSDVFLVSSLIDMYSKCGVLEDARLVFEKLATKNMGIWNTMLAAYAMHGYGEDALIHFEEMCERVQKVDSASFSSLLSACCHAGLVDEGLHYFESMNPVYGISPSAQHCGKVVDILSRAGRLHEAEHLVKTMACEPGVGAWMALLGGCRIHGNLQMGERAAMQVLRLDPECAAGYVLLSNLYAALGKWELSENIQQSRLQLGIRKQPGCTWIEIGNQVHCFTVNDSQHPEIDDIHEEWHKLLALMLEAGYIPDTTFALHDVDDESKKVQLSHHSEKLAIAFGLMRTPPGSPLCIFKNLRVCGDCHTATKFITKLTLRTIIVRDNTRFHHFENGHCSCNDRW